MDTVLLLEGKVINFFSNTRIQMSIKKKCNAILTKQNIHGKNC